MICATYYLTQSARQTAINVKLHARICAKAIIIVVGSMLKYEIRLTSLFSSILYPCFLSKLIRRIAGENPECDEADHGNTFYAHDMIALISEQDLQAGPVLFVSIRITYHPLYSPSEFIIVFIDVPVCSDFVDAIVFNPEIFANSRTIVVSPEAYCLPYEIIQINTNDGVGLMGYLILQEDFPYKSAPTIIFYHGNSGNIGDSTSGNRWCKDFNSAYRLYFAKKLYRDVKVNIFLVEYRGFGFSQGHASEQGVYRDAQAAFDYVSRRSDLDSDQIIVYGRSLGGAVAIDLATRPDYKDRIAVLVVENTFSSVSELARNILPNFLMPIVKIFRLTDKFASYKKISSVVRPTFFISGLEDALIPPDHMTKLYMGCKARKKIIRFRHGDHMNSWTINGYTNVFADFMQDSIKRFPVSKIPINTIRQCRDDDM